MSENTEKLRTLIAPFNGSADRHRTRLPQRTNPATLAMLGIYRFEAGRIAEGRRLSSPIPWSR